MIERRHPLENPQIPAWLHEVKNAYRACRSVEDSADSELGFHFNSYGDIERRFNEKYRQAFYSAIAEVSSVLPEYVQYKGIRPQGRILVVNDVIVTGNESQWNLYFLPQTDAIYRVNPMMAEKPEFIPGSDGFIGFDHLIDNKNWGADVISLTHDEEQAWGELDPEEMLIIIQNIDSVLQKMPEHERIVQLKNEIRDIEEATNEEKKKAEDKWGTQMKQRICNLLDTVNMYPFLYRKLPKVLEGKKVFDEGRNEGDRRIFLMRDTRTLVRIPVEDKKPIFGIMKRIGERADFSKAEAASLSDWVESGIIAYNIVNALPIRGDYYHFFYTDYST